MVAGVAIGLLVPAVPVQAGFGELRAVSLTPGGGAFGDEESFDPILSGDGRFVVFSSSATNLVPGQSGGPVIALFLRDLTTGQTTLVSHAAGDPGAARTGEQPSISADGRFVAYLSEATDLISGFMGASTEKIYLFDRTTGGNVLVSHAASSETTNANAESFLPDISADGRFVAFESVGSDLVTGQDDGATPDDDVFLYEVATKTNRLVSHTAASPTKTGDGGSRRASISDDGGRVAFQSTAEDLTGGTSTADRSVFVFDRGDGTIRRVSRNASTPANSADGDSFGPEISGDGQWVLFPSSATTLVPGFDNNNGVVTDAYVAAVDSNTTLLASHGPAGPADGASRGVSATAISQDGSTALFVSSAADLVPGQVDTNEDSDAFTFSRGSGAVTLQSAVPGNPLQTGNGFSDPSAMSANGRFIALESPATNLVAGQQDENGDADALVRDIVLGVTRLVSHTPAGVVNTGNGRSGEVTLSGDGRIAAFNSGATDLVPSPADGNGALDVFAALNLPPAASATVSPGSGDAPLAVALGAAGSFDPDGAIVSHEWNHGDGTSSTGATSSHTYATARTYTVTLTVRDEDGATATATRTVVVTDLSPGLRGLRIVPQAFAPLSRGDSIGSQRSRGATVRYTLSEAARVRLSVQRRTTGRRVGRRCVKTTRRNRSRRRCTRFVRVRGSFTHAGKARQNRFRFSGRVRGRALRRGRYRLVARAVDPAGNRSRVRRAGFRIVRRR